MFLKSQVSSSAWCLCGSGAASQSPPLLFNFDSNPVSSPCNYLTLREKTLGAVRADDEAAGSVVRFRQTQVFQAVTVTWLDRPSMRATWGDAGRRCGSCVRPSVGVIAIVVGVAVLLAGLAAAWRRGVFSAGRVRRHPPLLVFPHAALEQARVGRGRRFHGGRFEPGVLSHRLRSVFGLVPQQRRLQGLEEQRRVQPDVAWGRGRRQGGR